VGPILARNVNAATIAPACPRALAIACASSSSLQMLSTVITAFLATASCSSPTRPDRRVQKFCDVLSRWKARELSGLEASEVLGCSERQFRRYRRRYEQEGLEGLFDKRLRKASARRCLIDSATLDRAGKGNAGHLTLNRLCGLRSREYGP
jgi:Winged helix-turn helix